MKLHSPFEISSRLLPGLRIGGAWIQLEIVGSTSEGRTRYRWTIDLPDGSEFSGSDLRSGCQGGDLQEGFESLLDFLSACGESWHYSGKDGESADLFPQPVAEWAAQNSDDLTLLRLEIEEAESDLIEA